MGTSFPPPKPGEDTHHFTDYQLVTRHAKIHGAVLDGDGLELSVGKVAYDAADVQYVATIVVGFARDEGVDADKLRGVDYLMAAYAEGHVADGAVAEEDQVAGLHLPEGDFYPAFDLLGGVSGEKYAV